MRKWLFLISALVPLVSSCKIADALSDTAGELFRGEIVARAGDHKLHRSQLESYIPHGVSPDDSINLARQYIDAWAEDLLMLDMAEEQLSKAEKDVSRELEEYRRTLLKYRYEQRYIDQRLDTLITDAEITAFYKENPEKFRLERPIVKARYILIPAEAKIIKDIRKLMSSDDDADVMDAAALAETGPFAPAFARLVARVGLRPCVPHVAGVALGVQRHAYLQPFGVVERRRVYRLERVRD